MHTDSGCQLASPTLPPAADEVKEAEMDSSDTSENPTIEVIPSPENPDIEISFENGQMKIALAEEETTKTTEKSVTEVEMVKFETGVTAGKDTVEKAEKEQVGCETAASAQSDTEKLQSATGASQPVHASTVVRAIRFRLVYV